MFNLAGKAAFGLVLFSLGVQFALAGTLAVAGATSVSKQNSNIPPNGENAPQPPELSRCSRSPKPRKEISCLDHGAREYSREGNHSEAEILLKRELAIAEKELPPFDRRVTRVLRSLAMTYLAENKWPDAEPIYARLSQVPLPAAADCGGEHYWGDQLHCYVTFRGKPRFNHVDVVFNLPSDEYRQADAAQPGQFINFILRDAKKISHHTYVVNGVLSNSVPGIYILAAVSARSDYGYRSYTNGYQFSSIMAMRVKAPDAGKTVEPESPAQPKVPLNIPIRSIQIQAEIRPESKPLPKTPLAVERNPTTNQVQARTQNACGGSHKPGQTLTCYVVFEKEDDSNSVQLAFSTPIGATIRGGLCNGFMLDKWQRIDDRTFKVSGVLPWCTSFTYVLTTVLVQSKTRGYVQYQNGTDFKSDVNILLKNSNRTLFPEMKNVSPIPPAKRWWNRVFAKFVSS